jgi:hypothetical protein
LQQQHHHQHHRNTSMLILYVVDDDNDNNKPSLSDSLAPSQPGITRQHTPRNEAHNVRVLQSEGAKQHRARRTRLGGARRRLRQSSSTLLFSVAVSCCSCLFVSSAVLMQGANPRPHRHLSSKSTTLSSKSTTLRRVQDGPVHVTAVNNEDNIGSVEPSAKQHANNCSGDPRNKDGADSQHNDGESNQTKQQQHASSSTAGNTNQENVVTLYDHDDIDAATGTATTQPEAEHHDEVLKTFETTRGPAHASLLSTRLVLGTIVGFIAMIFTAWQMSDFPDGLYASLCRGTIAVIALCCAFCRLCVAPHFIMLYLAPALSHQDPIPDTCR